MKFKELFDKQMLLEKTVRKQLKIFYEIDLQLIKPKKEEVPPEQNQQVQQQVPAQEIPPAAQEPAIPPTMDQMAGTPPEADMGTTPPPTGGEVTAPSAQELGLASVVTEDEEKNDDDKIERKLHGEIELTEEERDNIQSFEDLISVMSKKKVNGDAIFDEFSSEVISLCCNQKFQELQNEVDKKSKIFVEIYYGYNKGDSVGVRFNKRSNSDTLTSSMLVDNEIINSKFSIDRVNQKIVEFRNYEAKNFS